MTSNIDRADVIWVIGRLRVFQQITFSMVMVNRVTDAEATEYHRRMTALFKAIIRRFSFASTFAARSFCVLKHGSTACAAPCPGSGNGSANMNGPIFFEKISQIGNYPSYLAVRLQSQGKEVIDRDGKRAPR